MRGHGLPEVKRIERMVKASDSLFIAKSSLGFDADASQLTLRHPL